MTVNVKRVWLKTEHENQKWAVWEASVDGVPAVTKRVSIAVAGIVTDPTIVERARAKLIADVTEYHANYLVLQSL